MSQILVIVESPKKAQLIQGFLNKNKLSGYKVMASAGHVRDLKKRPLGIDIENNYAPIYEVTEDKVKLIKELKAEAKKSDLVYLASDEDREGEAIAWHLSEALALDPKRTKRIVFHEITSEAFMEALANPRDIDLHLVDAQQARRVLDRLVGFELSPVLWRRVRPSLSAGRVQSVAVRLVVEREREIASFIPTSTYRVLGQFALPSGTLIKAELDHRFDSEDEAKAFLAQCHQEAFRISDLQKRQGKRSPAAPFTTSTLQQEASSRLGYSVSTTMRLAQSLYESGHITYMRTDSVNLSNLALGTIGKEIKAKYGEDYHQPRKYTTKSKGAQEAHEAIRPTYINHVTIDGSAQEKKLYELIYRRAMASQMADAQIERTTVTIPVGQTGHNFVATGEVITFRGFLELYLDADSDDAKLLPPMSTGELLLPQSIEADERYTQRPARYTEASMVSKMEELGIGRPSTYAPTIQTIQARGYVERGDKEGTPRHSTTLSLLPTGLVERSVRTEMYGADKGKLLPTDMGTIVNDFLVEHFPDIVNYGFTAQVESDFDSIAEGKQQWQSVIDGFYKGFHPSVQAAQTIEPGSSRVGARELGIDPETGRKVIASMGRFGSMVQIGTTDDGEDKPRYASLRPTQTLETISLEEALELFRLPKSLGTFEDKEVSVAIGRFGPYIKHNSKFTSLPKGIEPLDVTLEDAIRYIVEKREAEEKSLLRTFAEEEGLEIRQGRFGPYIKYQGENYKISADLVDTIAYSDVKQLIEQAPAKGKKRSSPKATTTGKTTAKNRISTSKSKAK